jgi:non-heme chloroperoxidase
MESGRLSTCCGNLKNHLTPTRSRNVLVVLEMAQMLPLRSWFAVALFSLLAVCVPAQMVPWHDPSPHRNTFVTLADDVKLEVLDWGGSGRSLVLLAGLGATAHTFDEFALKLVPDYHVYGVTRRGFGASSAPRSGYSADRLGDDVLAVLDALKLERSVLVGHSLAGEELSSVGTRYPERVGALIYLDAAYGYAYYDASVGHFDIDLQEMRRKLDQLQPGKRPQDARELIRDILKTSLPAFERDLRNMEQNPSLLPIPKFPSPTAADRSSFSAAVAWQKRTYGFAIPESELRQVAEMTAEGQVGPNRADHAISRAINEGEQKYGHINVPTLAIFAHPKDTSVLDKSDPNAAAYVAAQNASNEAQIRAFRNGNPSARVIEIPNANHAVFLSNEEDVLREIQSFLTSVE